MREENDDYYLYDKLSDLLKEYNDLLIPELTMNKNNEFVLIISCDGNPKGIPFVDELTRDIQKLFH